jgi:hypothetical protein
MRAVMPVAELLVVSLCLTVACVGGELSLPNDGRPTALTAVSGGGQEATVGSRLPQPLVVRVTDAARQPVAGVSLFFRFTDEFPEAEILPALVRTDSLGRAGVEVRLGTTAGEQTVEAILAQDPAPEARATFGVTALEKTGRGGGEDDHEGDGKNKGGKGKGDRG